MKELVSLLVHPLTAIARLLSPGRAKPSLPQKLIIEQQLLILNRDTHATNTGPASHDLGIESDAVEHVHALSLAVVQIYQGRADPLSRRHGGLSFFLRLLLTLTPRPCARSLGVSNAIQ